MHGWRATPWSMGNLPGITSLEKTDPSSPSSNKSSLSGVEIGESLFLYARLLTGLIICRPCACDLSCHAIPRLILIHRSTGTYLENGMFWRRPRSRTYVQFHHNQRKGYPKLFDSCELKTQCSEEARSDDGSHVPLIHRHPPPSTLWD